MAREKEKQWQATHVAYFAAIILTTTCINSRLSSDGSHLVLPRKSWQSTVVVAVAVRPDSKQALANARSFDLEQSRAKA